MNHLELLNALTEYYKIMLQVKHDINEDVFKHLSGETYDAFVDVAEDIDS